MDHLYIHFPFCANRCGYCDFYSQAGRLELAPAYVEALLAELETCGAGVAGGLEVAGGLDTVYLGGGTPTIVGAELLGKILSAVGGRCRMGAEVTVEANPSTVTPALAASLGAAGANRVSLGVQSFNRRLRRNLGRAGPVEAITGAVEALRAAGFDNIGLDLMFSIPGQTAADLDRDLERTLELKPEHISCYELTVRDGSDFKRRWSRELEAVAAQGRGFYEKVVDRLEDAGYRWYETSNFALPGKECRHNLAYWDGADYIGLGAGAWSTVGLGRWKNLEDINAYIAASGTVRSRAGGFKRARARAGGFKQARFKQARDHERLSGENRLREKLLLGLRRDVGVERGQVAAAIDSEQENLLLRNGFLVNDGGRICLTRRGRFMANEVSARLLRD